MLQGMLRLTFVTLASFASVAMAAGRATSTAASPDWSGLWTQPDSEFLTAMGRVAHGSGPESPAYRREYLMTHSTFGLGAARGSSPGALTGGPPSGGGPGPPGGARGPSLEANAAACLPNGVPAVMGVPVGREFLLTPGLLTILIEEGPTIRQVYLDGRPHSAEPDPSYTGESIGHWEGQTLVVDTVGISPKAQFFFGVSTSGKTHMIERIHLVDKDHLLIDTEIDDPVALARPWHYSWTYVRTKTDFMSNICDRASDRDRDGEPDLTPPPGVN